MRDDQRTLVLCGTGKTGSRVARRLKERGIPTRIGSRAADPTFDWRDEATWAPALAGIRAVYLAYHPDLAVPGAPEAAAAFTDRARAAGVRRMVLLSGRGEPEAQRAEQLVRNIAPECSVLRCAWFNQNFSEGYLADEVAAGQIVLPAGEVGEPFLDCDDIADVAVAALTSDDHAGELYELTGPRLLSFAEAAREISAARGIEVGYTQVTMDRYAAGPTEFVPPEVIGLLTHLFTEVLDGRNAQVADGVVRALGRPPRDFARDAVASGVWGTR